jgi:hypothetical protein
VSCIGVRIFKKVDPNPLGYVAYKLSPEQSILIDGKLDDEAWQQVPWTPYFQDIEGYKKPTPRYKTYAKIRYDNQFLYIGAWLEEPNLVATLKQRDSVIYHDNDFEVFMNPSGNVHMYQEYEMNAFNTIWNLVMINPYRNGYNIINPYPFDVKSAVYANGTINNPSDVDCCWSIEIAFPFAGLRNLAERRSPPKDGDSWRINFSRVEWHYKVVNGTYVKEDKPEDNWVWSPQWVIDMHQPEKWGFVQFSEKLGIPFTFPQASYDIQSVLYWIQQAQFDYYNIFKNYAFTYKELNITQESFDLSKGASPIVPGLTLYNINSLDDFGFDAMLMYSEKGRQTYIWHIRNDSKQWWTPAICPQN